MKRFILLLCLSMPILAQSQNSSDDRKVLSQTVTMWQNNYSYIEKIKLIGTNPADNNMVLPKDKLITAFQGLNAATINFWYYMQEDNIPRIAIELPVDENRMTYFLVHNNENQWEPQEMSTLGDYFTAWKNLAYDTTNILIYVEMYQFDKEYVFNALNNSEGLDVTIENVVHSIAPNTTRYLAPSEHKGPQAEDYEGFLVLDILIKLDGDTQDPSHINFARPCPKLCPPPKD
jgi:hypothetical protein